MIRLPSRTVVIGIVMATLGASTAVTAQVTAYSGSTAGCFGLACIPTPGVITLPGTGLTFEWSSFSGLTSVTGVAAIGTNANAQGTQDVDNLGAFYLTSALSNYSGASFTLLVTFLLPGNGSTQTTATLTGSVLAPDVGGVIIDFDNNPLHISLGGGQFIDLSIADVNVTAPIGNQGCPAGTPPNISCAPITGHFVLVNPEPLTLAMTGTGLLGLGLASIVKRRRKASA